MRTLGHCAGIAVVAALTTTGCILYGCVLRNKSLHNGNECEMTWSSIRFILLPSPLDRQKQQQQEQQQEQEQQKTCSLHFCYKLLKFTDARDERFDPIVDYNRPYQEQDVTTFHVKPNVNWCKPKNLSGKPGRIVLYVPGHEGTYMQARSLGAHGTTLTRHGKDLPRRKLNNLLRRLWDGSMNASARDVSDFLFDVYSVDFGGEGGGIHGSRLFAQTTFVVSALERLAEECHEDEPTIENPQEFDIVIVAHSIGGLVARRAALLVNQKRHENGKSPLVKTVITLASPHGGVPFVFDSSIYRFQWDIQKKKQEWFLNNAQQNGIAYNLVSICGGLRDELIPPSSCRVDVDGTNEISVLATNIVIPSPGGNHGLLSGFGMDHNAIVWCHGVLSFVRQVIHAAEYDKILKLIQETQRVIAATDGETCNYDCQNIEKEKLLQEEYGWLRAFAIMTSMLYNSQLSLVLYVMNGILHCLFLFWRRCFGTMSKEEVSHSYFFIPVLSSMIAMVTSVGNSQLGFGSILFLAFNAMNVYSGIYYGMFSYSPSTPVMMLLPWNTDPSSTKSKLEISTVSPSSTTCLNRKNGRTRKLILASLMVVLLTCAIVFKEIMVVNVISFGAMMFITHTVTTMCCIAKVGFATRNDPKSKRITRSIVSTLFLLFPILSVGKIIFALSLLTRHGQTKAIPYMDFERSQWDSLSCQARLCEAISFLKYDLPRYTVFICVPIHFFCVKRMHQVRIREDHDQFTKKDR